MKYEDEIRYVGNTQYKVGTTIDRVTTYNYELVVDYFEAMGRIANPNFKIYQTDYQLVYHLTNYFIGNKESCDKNGIYLNKGLLLYGAPGVGKTTLLQIISTIGKGRKILEVISCSDLANQYAIEGMTAIKKVNMHKSLILDDIGSERITQYFGNEIEVVAYVIKKFEDGKNIFVENSIRNKLPVFDCQNRNNIRTLIHKDVKMHATTNCNLEDLEKRYGERIYSRMANIYNVVNFNKESIDKRLV